MELGEHSNLAISRNDGEHVALQNNDPALVKVQDTLTLPISMHEPTA